jgi:hypothetical protein
MSIDRIGQVKVEVKYHDKSAILECEVMKRNDEIQLILGYPDWPKLGFHVGGIILDKPNVITSEDVVVEKERFDDDSDDELDPRIVAALERNAQIDPHSVCSHPLAVLDLPTSEEPTMFARRNFVKPDAYPAVDEVVKSWLEDGVIEEAPNDTKCVLPILTVPKHDDEGKISGTRVCIDMREFNKLLNPDNYELPTVSEVIATVGEYSGPESRRTKIDCSAAYHRFSLKDKIIAFVWRGKIYRFTRAMFGVKTMTAKFQRVVDSISIACSYTELSRKLNVTP